MGTSLEKPSPTELVRRIAGSPVFLRSKRHAALLQFLADEAGSELKEVVIGHRFFDRPADYDPKIDPVVRVEIRRLRERLDEYYRNGGTGDLWRVEVPKGSYRISIAPNPGIPSDTPQESSSVPVEPPRPIWKTPTALVIAALLLAIAVTLAIVIRPPVVTHPVRSIAVLELENSGGVSEEMVSGLQAEIASALMSIGDLLVIGPSAAARARPGSGGPDIRKIAEALNVDAVLGGTIGAIGSRVRLQMQLTRGSDGAVLWAQSDERNLVDPFTLQSEFAALLAGAVNLKLLHRPASQPQISAEALMDFRRGTLQVERRTGPSILKGIAFLESAVARDPQYAAAWGTLAEAYAMAPDYLMNEGEWPSKARQAAARALQLDPSNADAYSALGWVEFSEDLRVGDARKSLRRALSLNPNHLTAQRRLGLLYLAIGRFREAEQALQAAVRLDPLSQIVHINLAEMHFAKRDYAAEERELRGVLEANPSYELALMMLAVALSSSGQCEEARASARRMTDNQEASQWWPTMATVLARCGDLGPARRMAAANQPPGAADHLSAVVGDWPRARKYIAELVATRPLAALNYSFNELWLADPEIRRSIEALQERIRASDRAQ